MSKNTLEGRIKDLSPKIQAIDNFFLSLECYKKKLLKSLLPFSYYCEKKKESNNLRSSLYNYRKSCSKQTFEDEKRNTFKDFSEILRQIINYINENNHCKNEMKKIGINIEIKKNLEEESNFLNESLNDFDRQLNDFKKVLDKINFSKPETSKNINNLDSSFEVQKPKKVCNKQQTQFLSEIQETKNPTKYEIRSEIYENALTAYEGNNLFSGLIGLKNLGNTCYLNSILQCLSHSNYFKNLFINPENNEKIMKYKSNLSFKFSNFLKEMWFNQQKKLYLDPSELWKQIGIINNKVILYLHFTIIFI